MQRYSFPGEAGLCSISQDTRDACAEYMASPDQATLPPPQTVPLWSACQDRSLILKHLLGTYLTAEPPERYLKDGDRRIKGAAHGSDSGPVGLSIVPTMSQGGPKVNVPALSS